MRAVAWLSVIFATSALVGVGCWVAAGHVTGADRGVEGLLALVMLFTAIVLLGSGLLLFFIMGPAALEEWLRRNRTS